MCDPQSHYLRYKSLPDGDKKFQCEKKKFVDNVQVVASKLQR